jgi:hypothetical protein
MSIVPSLSNQQAPEERHTASRFIGSGMRAPLGFEAGWDVRCSSGLGGGHPPELLAFRTLRSPPSYRSLMTDHLLLDTGGAPVKPHGL